MAWFPSSLPSVSLSMTAADEFIDKAADEWGMMNLNYPPSAFYLDQISCDNPFRTPSVAQNSSHMLPVASNDLNWPRLTHKSSQQSPGKLNHTPQYQSKSFLNPEYNTAHSSSLMTMAREEPKSVSNVDSRGFAVGCPVPKVPVHHHTRKPNPRCAHSNPECGNPTDMQVIWASESTLALSSVNGEAVNILACFPVKGY
jgi:hypothetical protein